MPSPGFGGAGFSKPGLGPGAWTLIGLTAVPFLLAWFGARGILVPLALVPEAFLAQPWTALTYPLSSTGNGREILFVFITCWWLSMVAGALEARLKTAGLLAASGMLLLVSAGAFVLSGFLVPTSALAGTSLLIGALTVLWGVQNKDHQVLLMFVIPIKAIWLAAVTAVIVLFGYGTTHPVAGLFALIPLAVAYVWGSGLVKLPKPDGIKEAKAKKKQSADFDNFMDDVRRREKEREEKEQLRRLFERSLRDDDPPADR